MKSKKKIINCLRKGEKIEKEASQLQFGIVTIYRNSSRDFALRTSQFVDTPITGYAISKLSLCKADTNANS